MTDGTVKLADLPPVPGLDADSGGDHRGHARVLTAPRQPQYRVAGRPLACVAPAFGW